MERLAIGSTTGWIFSMLEADSWKLSIDSAQLLEADSW
jgi:hypothetical protein